MAKLAIDSASLAPFIPTWFITPLILTYFITPLILTCFISSSNDILPMSTSFSPGECFASDAKQPFPWSLVSVCSRPNSRSMSRRAFVTADLLTSTSSSIVYVPVSLASSGESGGWHLADGWEADLLVDLSPFWFFCDDVGIGDFDGVPFSAASWALPVNTAAYHHWFHLHWGSLNKVKLLYDCLNEMHDTVINHHCAYSQWHYRCIL